MSAIKFNGLDQLQAALTGTPQQLRRARRSAINKTITDALKRIRNPIKQKLGIQAKQINQRLKIRRAASSGEPSGSIEPSNALLPLTLYRFKVRRVAKFPTRASVEARLDINGRVRAVPGVFVNPKHAAKKPFFRPEGIARLPIRPALAPSIAAHVEVIADKKFMDKTADFLSREFNFQFQRQLKK